MRKISRTISGVTPLAVMVEPASCPGRCLYCPTHSHTPQSYTAESPVVIRARRVNYDAGKQVQNRLLMFSEMGHPTDKIELIVMGGTFLAYPREYQYQFIKDCYDALNENPSTGLEEAKKANEKAKHRCVGLCIETRPDWCGKDEIESLLAFGATRVELGVQTLDDDIYRLVRRGHTITEVVEATRRLKDYGFKVYYHWMPGLPGSSPEHDLEMTHELFRDERFRPDGLKLYPTLVIAGTVLEKWYLAHRYQPYPPAEMIELMAKIKATVPPYVRISRVMRDIPVKYIVAGLKDLSLREDVKRQMSTLGLNCRCIRCREWGHRSREGWPLGKPELKKTIYEASDGKEIFLSYEDKHQTLFGLLRLRKSDGQSFAFVRELHVFGPQVPLGEDTPCGVQHQGLGAALLKEAECIAREELEAIRLKVISGVGARDYFRNYGYELDGAYMNKDLCQ